MKKLFLIGMGFVLAVAVFGTAGFVYAQTQEPPEPQTNNETEFPYGSGGWDRGTPGGRMGGRKGIAPGGMMGWGLDEGEGGPLHDYLWPALAEAFGLSNEQVEAFEIVRETMQGIRENLSQEEIRDAMQLAMTTAIEDALADGAITEEQAEQWLERLEQMEGFAPRMPFGGRGEAGIYRQGFSNGFKVGRQMMINHEYLDAAIAEALEMSVEDFQEMREEEGFNWATYAEEQGLTDEEFHTLRKEVFTNAINAALEDEAITQEQADWALERLENFEGRGTWFGHP
jgi:hypothetical protein